MARRAGLVCALLAVTWGIVLLVGAFTVPVYRGATVSVPCPGCAPIVEDRARTLVAVNGPSVALPVGVPLFAALAVSALLTIRAATGSGIASLAAWLLVVVLGVFTLAAMFSIGLYVLPSVLLLAGAAALVPSAPRTPTAPAAGAARG